MCLFPSIPVNFYNSRAIKALTPLPHRPLKELFLRLHLGKDRSIATPSPIRHFAILVLMTPIIKVYI